MRGREREERGRRVFEWIQINPPSPPFPPLFFPSVYGALLWSLSRVIRTPEVVRVYVSSFNGATPLRADVNPAGVDLFKSEAADLLSDIQTLPARATDHKISAFVKRAKSVLVHARVVDAIKKALPLVGSRAKAQARIAADLPSLFRRVAADHNLALSDFPDPARYAELLAAVDVGALPKIKGKSALEDVLRTDVPALVAHFDNPYRKRE